MQNIEEIVKNMREPKLKDIRAVSHIENLEDKEIKLVSNLTGLSEEELGELTFSDYAKLSNKLASFLSPAGKSA